MKYGLDILVVQKIQQVFAGFPQINEVILYGSRAKGNYNPGSDLDLTVKGENLSLSVMNQIGLDIDDLMLPYIVDISVFSHIKNPDLLENIHRVGIVFYQKEFSLKF